MCTLSWWIKGSGRGVLFNRDEKRDRARGLPPCVFPARACGGAVLGPVDAEKAGTWLGVNECGVIGGVLNFYPHYQGEVPNRRSRGLMLLDLLRRSRSAEELIEAAGALESPRSHRGFILFGMDTVEAPRAASWDGDDFLLMPLDPVAGFLTTSSWHPERIRHERALQFADVDPAPDSLRRAHAMFDSETPALSPLMVRKDAMTDSITEVQIGGGQGVVRFSEVRGDPPVPAQAAEARLPYSETIVRP